MATTDNSITFKIKIVTGENDWNTELKGIEELLASENNSDNLVAFITNNSGTKGAIAVRYEGGDIVTVYNSEDCYKISTRNEQEAKEGVTGLFSSYDFALLNNLNKNLNIEETTSIVNENSTILNDIISLADEKENPDNTKTLYNLNADKIINFKNMINDMDTMKNEIENINNYLDLGNNANSTLKEYISQQIEENLSNVIEGYINHTHM